MPNRANLVSKDALAAESLPKSYSIRWGPRQKAQVVEAVQRGLLRLDVAVRKYRLSLEEFRGWQREVRLRQMAELRKAVAKSREFGRRGRSEKHSDTQKREWHLV